MNVDIGGWRIWLSPRQVCPEGTFPAAIGLELVADHRLSAVEAAALGAALQAAAAWLTAQHSGDAGDAGAPRCDP